MNYKNLTLSLAALATAFVFAACGDNATSGTTGASGSNSNSAPDVSEATKQVEITANDQMKFNIDDFTVAPGEVVALTLKNVGTMPKFSMGHNVVILEQSVEPTAFAEASMNEAGNDYIPQNSDDQIVAHTAMLGGGEEDTIVFTAPEATGEYPFICSFPGHLQVGMEGTMIVE